MPLYGHELNETTDPLSAGLEWAVDLSKDFIGAAALRSIAAEGGPATTSGVETSTRAAVRRRTTSTQATTASVSAPATISGVTPGR